MVIASDDGSIYSLDASSGTRRWKAFVGTAPNEVLVFDNAIVSSITSGKVTKVDSNGRLVWSLNLNDTAYNVTYIYGATVNSRFIFVTTDNGVYAIDKNGHVRAKLMSFARGLVSTPPAAGGDFIVFGLDKELIRLHETGLVAWRTSLDDELYWLSSPVLTADSVYVGALDGKLHAFLLASGSPLWEFSTKNWVRSTPYFSDGAIYFGSDDGGFYSVDMSGSLIWKSQAALGIQTTSDPGVMAGRPVMFVGSTDGSLYAIDRTDGQIVWKASAGGMASSPLFYSDEVIFGSQDHNVYAYSTERACSLVAAREADQREFEVNGRVISRTSGASVAVSINSGDWKTATADGESWSFFINPKTSFSPGLNTISCKALDSGGEESGDTFPTVTLNYDSTTQPGNLNVRVSPNIIENEQFIVFVNDAADGSQVKRFTVTLNGKDYPGNGNVTIKGIPTGSYPASVKKVGYNNAAIKVDISSKGMSPIMMGAIGVGVLLFLILIGSKLLKKKTA